MSGTDITLAHDRGVATITLERREDGNRITPAALAQLGSFCAELGRDDATHAVVITGAGSEYFSMGILNPALRAAHSKDEILDIVRLANATYDAVEALPQIVIAALNGITRAGAAELALACDIRLAASHARLAFPEAQWGGFPGAGGPIRLPALIGRARALELICTGREIDASEMARIGFVVSVHSGTSLMPETRAMAEKIAANGPLATRGAKRIDRVRMTAGDAAARDTAWELRRALEWSSDVDEAIAAHREGRAPRFTGR